ncbi:hypothetical protein NBRC10513v2_001596 [Rhodotorula toruloides]|uniref:Uncharacterized protein n=2 Tax=Rhodotorula toruloides TaxID=5286 RepID=A0A2T0A6P1_RHOTO|nr:hypothetical protein AAT19DRAFT_15261 [Rhodotorula toruloides]
MAQRILRLLRQSLGKRREERATGDVEAEEGGSGALYCPSLHSGASTAPQTVLPILIPPPTRPRTRTPSNPSPNALQQLIPHTDYHFVHRPSPAASLAPSPTHSYASRPGNGFSTFLREYRQQMSLDDAFGVDIEDGDDGPPSSLHSSWQGSLTYRDGCCSSIHTHVQDLVGGFSDEEPLIFKEYDEDEEDDCDDGESDGESFRCKTAAEIERAWEAREAELARDLRAGRARVA